VIIFVGKRNESEREREREKEKKIGGQASVPSCLDALLNPAWPPVPSL